MKVIILRGLPGSGKSTFTSKMEGVVKVVSADHYFHINDDQVYRFDPSKLGAAHAYCLRTFVNTLTKEDWVDTLVVDNTNCSAVEIAPYYALAQAYGVDCTIVHINTNLSDEELSDRNVHGVPVATIARMRTTIAREQLPPWWNVEKVSV
jgi:predicted kinase